MRVKHSMKSVYLTFESRLWSTFQRFITLCTRPTLHSYITQEPIPGSPLESVIHNLGVNGAIRHKSIRKSTLCVGMVSQGIKGKIRGLNAFRPRGIRLRGIYDAGSMSRRRIKEPTRIMNTLCGGPTMFLP